MAQITTIFRLPTMTQEKYDRVTADLEKAGLGKVPARTAHIMSLADPRMCNIRCMVFKGGSGKILRKPAGLLWQIMELRQKNPKFIPSTIR